MKKNNDFINWFLLGGKLVGKNSLGNLKCNAVTFVYFQIFGLNFFLFWTKFTWILMSVTMTNHLVIWNRTCLEGISRESLKTDFMSRHNVFQFWFIIIYLRLTHTILWLEIIPYNINEQFDTFGDGINFLSWIWGHKSIMSRRNAFWIMPDFLCLGRFRAF